MKPQKYKKWNSFLNKFRVFLCSCSYNCSMIFHRRVWIETTYNSGSLLFNRQNYNGKSFFTVNNLPSSFLLVHRRWCSRLDSWTHKNFLQAKSNFLIFYYSIMRLCFSSFINSQQESWKFYSFFIVVSSSWFS